MGFHSVDQDLTSSLFLLRTARVSRNGELGRLQEGRSWVLLRLKEDVALLRQCPLPQGNKQKPHPSRLLFHT